jgi:hypothetical protein
MKVAKVVALVGVLAMGTALVYGFVVGDFAGEGKVLLGMPWGIVSLVDVYTGIALFSCWVVFRERSALRSVAWIVSFVVLGFFAVSIYVWIALQRSEGDWQRFFLGNRIEGNARSA